MIESRCGISCADGHCKQEWGVDCPGCINIEKPFWGECPLKKCCEEKQLENCGKCGDFPCALLTGFAYDKEHGEGDGSRIEQCKKWCMAG